MKPNRSYFHLKVIAVAPLFLGAIAGLLSLGIGMMTLNAEDEPSIFMVSSHRPDSISFVDADGKILKQITDVKHAQDAMVLPDGRIFSSEIPGAKMFDSEGNLLWQYHVPEGCQNPVAQALGEDRFLVGNEGPCRLLEINSKGETLKTIQLSSTFDKSHGQFRFCRKTPEGTYLVPLTKENMVKEFDAEGNVVRDFGEFELPVSAIRLKDGGTLIGWHHRVTGFDAAGEKVWEFDLEKDAGLSPVPVTALARLDNGNVIIGCYHRDAARPEIIEVSPDKTVVRRVTIPELGNIAAVQLLDGDMRPAANVSAR